MRILVWNINALMPTIPNFTLKHGSLKGFFEDYNADIICLQETKLQSEEKLTKEAACVDGFESFWAFSREKKGYSGVVTYVAERYSPIEARVDCLGTGSSDIDREGRVVLTDLGAFVLINVYVPNAGDRSGDGERTAFKVRFLEALKEKSDALIAAGRQVMIVGDLNIAASQKDVYSKLDYARMYSFKEKALLQSLLKDYTDVWRLLHPDEASTFTVWDEKTSARAFNEGVRIDYALLSPGLLEHVVSCEVISTLPPKWSDHAAILLELTDIPEVPKHPPCALSSKRIKRFRQPKTSVASLFAKKRAAQSATAAPARADAAAAESADGKRQRTVDAKSPADGESVPNAACVPSTAGCGSEGDAAEREAGGQKCTADGVMFCIGNSGSSAKEGMENTGSCTAGVSAHGRDVGQVRESKGAEGKRTKDVSAIPGRKAASLTKQSGNQQRSIRSFFSAGNKS